MTDNIDNQTKGDRIMYIEANYQGESRLINLANVSSIQTAVSEIDFIEHWRGSHLYMEIVPKFTITFWVDGKAYKETLSAGINDPESDLHKVAHELRPHSRINGNGPVFERRFSDGTSWYTPRVDLSSETKLQKALIFYGDEGFVFDQQAIRKNIGASRHALTQEYIHAYTKVSPNCDSNYKLNKLRGRI